MTVFRNDLMTALQRRLCDEAGALWTQAELEGYIDEGYDDLTKRTGCLWDTAMLPDFAFAFSITRDWESDYVAAGEYANGPAQFTCQDDRNFIANARGPANHTQHWEFNRGYVTVTEVDGLADLPECLQEVERATWNTRRILAIRSRDVEEGDGRYELNKGTVEAYMQDKDGLGVLRKFRVPSAAYQPYTFDDGTDLNIFSYTQSWESTYVPTGAESNGPLEFTSGDDARFSATTDFGPGTHNYRWEFLWGYTSTLLPNDDGFGILRDLDGIVDTTVQSEGFGDLTQVDDVNVFEDFGILGPIYPDTSVVRIEYRRRGADLSDTTPFEIPDRYTIYVRHYAQARALEREGPGQDLKLAENFNQRYEAGLLRMLVRKQAMQYQKTVVMGGSSKSQRGPHLARLPWQYGAPVRR